MARTIICDESKRMGFSILMRITCSKCKFADQLNSSPDIAQTDQRGVNPLEVNTRSVMAIRQNAGSLLEMRNSVIATLFHSTNFALETTRHSFCTKGEDSWCKWQSDQVTGQNTYKKKVNLPVPIHEVVKQIFQDLANADTLGKCLHGLTQNANEAFNQLIWNRCPKSAFTSKTIVEMAVNSAIIVYNDGFLSLASVFQSVGIQPGHYFVSGAYKKNTIRLSQMGKKLSEEVKKRRKTLRSIIKEFTDVEKDKEGGEAYSAGNF